MNQQEVAATFAAFLEAVATGDLAQLQQLLGMPLDPATRALAVQGALVCAVCGEQEGAVRLLLATAESAQEAALTQQDPRGWTLLYYAAKKGRSREIVRLLLKAAPAAAAIVANLRDPAFGGELLLHACAGWADEALVRQLLAAHLAAATVATSRGLPGGPLSVAAMAGNLGAVRALLEAAPATAEAGIEDPTVSPGSRQPFAKCLYNLGYRTVLKDDPTTAMSPISLEDHLEATCLLLLATSTDAALMALGPAACGLGMDQAAWEAHIAWPLYPALVAARPSTPAQWQRIPQPCPGLATTLPAVLARSIAEAALLVARLPEGKRQWLRCAVLHMCLARAQRHLRAELPGVLLGRILALALEP